MAHIITSKTRAYRDIKPPVGSQVNWGHPLTQGLVGCWLMNEGGGLILKNIALNSPGAAGASWIVTRKGLSNSPQYQSGRNWNGDIQETFIFYFYQWQLTNWGQIYVHGGMTHDFNYSNYNASKQYYYRRAFSGSTPIWRGIPSSDFTTRGMKQLCILYDGSNTTNAPSAYVNLSYRAMPIDTPSPSGTVVTTAGNFRPVLANVYQVYCYRYNRIVSFKELQSLYEAPYQIIAIPKKRFVIEMPSPAQVGTQHIVTSKTKAYRYDKPPVGSQLNFSHPLSQKLAGLWLFNEAGGSLVNETVNKNVYTKHASMNWQSNLGGTTLRTPGGSNVVIALGYPNFLQPTKPFTVTAIASRSGNFVGNDGLFSSRTGVSGALGWLLYGKVTTNKAQFIAAGATAVSDAALPLSRLVHMVGLWDGTNVLLYINGKLQTTTGSGVEQTYGGGTVYGAQIGQYGGYECWLGDINLLSIYHRALTTAEIKSLYEAPYQMLKGPVSKRIIPFSGGGVTPPTVTGAAIMTPRTKWWGDLGDVN